MEEQILQFLREVDKETRKEIEEVIANSNSDIEW